MFILLTIGLFLLKFLAVGVVGLFFLEDLELTQSVSPSIYNTYLAFGCVTFFALLFFILGKKFLWLIVFLICGSIYLGMYNGVEEIANIHKEHDLKSRYFKDTETFIARMGDVLEKINSNF